jgi:hypothetical protein
LVPVFNIEESSGSRPFEFTEGVLEPVREGDWSGDPFIAGDALSRFVEANDAFSSPVIASEMALNPVARDLEKKVLPGAAGDGTGRSIDEVSLLAMFGDAVTAAIFGGAKSSFVTVGGGDGEMLFHGLPIGGPLVALEFDRAP